jgi:hypothetical protein
MAAFDGGFLDGAVHPLDPTVSPWTVGLRQPALDIVLPAGAVEGVSS